MLQTVKIKDNIYSIKAIGYLDVNFHGCIFKNEEGASYNSYLIIDEQITLIDLVDTPYTEEFLRRIKEIIQEKPIDNIIINHVEPDHSGGFEILKANYPNAKCYCSIEAKKAMLQMFFNNHDFTCVENLQTITSGKYSYTFILTPLIHWPDNMICYLNEEKILFSNDAFGSLINSNKVYDDEYELPILLNHTKEYYANILQPCNRYVDQKLKEISELNLEFDLIAPAHGCIWRTHINTIYSQYQSWARADSIDKVVIVYDTIWDNTQMITDEIAVAIANKGFEVRVYNASLHRPSLIMTEILDAKALLIGSSNFNNTMTPKIADILERIHGLKPINKVAMAYGSYGWVDIHLSRIEARLKDANIKVIQHALYENYTPDQASLAYAKEVGEKLASKIKKENK